MTLMFIRPMCSSVFEQVSILKCRLTLVGVSSCIILGGVQRNAMTSLSDSYTLEVAVLAKTSSSTALYMLS